MTRRALVIGVISDTHGLLRPEARRALRGVERILHAGDIGDAAILQLLATIAPVTAVRGNCDRDHWARALPEVEDVQLGELRVRVLHERHRLLGDPRAEGLAVVVCGHSHMPLCERSDSVLFFNPGSAGPRRFDTPVTVGRLHISGPCVYGQIVRLRVPAAAS